MPAHWLVPVLACSALLSSACANPSSCKREPDSLTVKLGEGGSAVDGNTYYSAPYGGPYTYFPAFRTVTFEHGLGAIPYEHEFWLAFTPTGSLAPSAGNMTEIPADTDTDTDADAGTSGLNEKTISVYNDTCSEFYLWVVAERPSP